MDVQTAVEQLGRRQQGLATAAQLRAAGVSDATLHRALARREVLRLRRSVYALSALAPLPRYVVTADGVAPAYVAHVRAELLSLGPTAAARFRTAAALRGWGLLVEPARTVEVAVRHGRSRAGRREVTAQQRRSADTEELVALPGTAAVRITTALQTALDCAAGLPLLQAVVACDSALRSGQVTLDELEEAVSRLPGLRQAQQARRAVGLSDPRAGSVLESVHRVQMVLAGIDGFEPQVTVRALPALRVDFCFRAAGIVVEVDGAKWHQDPARDQARDNALAAMGWRVLRYTWAEVVHDSERVLQEIRAALACGSPSVHLWHADPVEAA